MAFDRTFLVQEKSFFENLLFEEIFFGESGCLESDNGHDRACEEVCCRIQGYL